MFTLIFITKVILWTVAIFSPGGLFLLIGHYTFNKPTKK